jgi:hypothetical protein
MLIDHGEAPPTLRTHRGKRTRLATARIISLGASLRNWRVDGLALPRHGDPLETLSARMPPDEPSEVK